MILLFWEAQIRTMSLRCVDVADQTVWLHPTLSPSPALLLNVVRGSFFRDKLLFTSGWEAVDLSASCWLSEHTKEVWGRRHSPKWCDAVQHQRCNTAQHNLAWSDSTQHRSTQKKHKGHWNTRGVSQNRPAVITENGRSSNWCQMLFACYFHIKWHFREWVQEWTHIHVAFEVIGNRGTESVLRVPLFYSPLYTCSSAVKSNFFQSLSNSTVTSLKVNKGTTSSLLKLNQYYTMLRFKTLSKLFQGLV